MSSHPPSLIRRLGNVIDSLGSIAGAAVLVATGVPITAGLVGISNDVVVTVRAGESPCLHIRRSATTSAESQACAPTGRDFVVACHVHGQEVTNGQDTASDRWYSVIDQSVRGFVSSAYVEGNRGDHDTVPQC